MVRPIDTSTLGPIKLDNKPEIAPDGCKQIGWLQSHAGYGPEMVGLTEGLTEADIKAGWSQRPVYVRI